MNADDDQPCRCAPGIPCGLHYAELTEQQKDSVAARAGVHRGGFKRWTPPSEHAAYVRRERTRHR